MHSIVDMAPYPWHLRNAQELHKTLYKYLNQPARVQKIAAKVGIDTGLVNFDQAPFDLWHELLDASARALLTRALVEKVREDPSMAATHEFFDALLRDAPVVVDSEPTGAGGRAYFFRGDDRVTEEEALLFGDDLTIPAGRIGWLIDVLQKLQIIAPSVCRLEVALNSLSQSGTGFCIGKDLLLTNWHVLSLDGAHPTSVSAEFGFDTDQTNQPVPASLYVCDPATIVTNKDDDWGVVRVKDPLPDSVPIVNLMIASGNPVDKEPTFIIQHPGGGRKRVAYVRNQVTFFDHRVVQYLSDTQVGSSGSPVLNESGRVIALHHAGGLPQPVKKNEGIRISRVIAGLQAAHLL